MFGMDKKSFVQWKGNVTAGNWLHLSIPTMDDFWVIMDDFWVIMNDFWVIIDDFWIIMDDLLVSLGNFKQCFVT